MCGVIGGWHGVHLSEIAMNENFDWSRCRKDCEMCIAVCARVPVCGISSCLGSIPALSRYVHNDATRKSSVHRVGSTVVPGTTTWNQISHQIKSQHVTISEFETPFTIFGMTVLTATLPPWPAQRCMKHIETAFDIHFEVLSEDVCE